jgi:hypothetical protein
MLRLSLTSLGTVRAYSRNFPTKRPAAFTVTVPRDLEDLSWDVRSKFCNTQIELSFIVAAYTFSSLPTQPVPAF